MQIIDFQGTKVRKLDNRMSAVDACRAIGYSEPATAWTKLRDRNSELLEYCLPTKLVGNDGIQRESETLDMNGVVILCMIARTAKAQEFRRWAAEQLKPIIERQMISGLSLDDIEGYLQAGLMAVSQVRELKAQIETDRPYTEQGKAFIELPGEISNAEMAKQLDTPERSCGRNTFCEWMVSKGYYYRDHNNALLSKQALQKQGLFVTSPTTFMKHGEKCASAVTRITTKGQLWVRSKWNAEFQKSGSI